MTDRVLPPSPSSRPTPPGALPGSATGSAASAAGPEAGSAAGLAASAAGPDARPAAGSAAGSAEAGSAVASALAVGGTRVPRHTLGDLRTRKRILVVGSGGAGKSTLARDLGTRLNLPVVHLDRVFWKPGWVEPTDAEFDARLNEALLAPRWIMDGNFSRTLPRRLEFADAAIFLDYPRWVCLWRVLTRVWQSRGTVRPDMADGCPEHFDPVFLRWVWDFRKRSRGKVVDALEASRGDTLVLAFRRPGDLKSQLSGI